MLNVTKNSLKDVHFDLKLAPIEVKLAARTNFGA